MKARTRRRWLALLATAVLALVTIGVVTWVTAPAPPFDASAAATFENGDPAKGRLVFEAGGCASCHASPGQSDRLRLGGGLELASPFGASRPPNISPALQDGIGKWRGVDLANALIGGVSPRGEHYYPALPYTSYVHMRTGDVKDLMAYLRTLPPVSGRPHPNELNLL